VIGRGAMTFRGRRSLSHRLTRRDRTTGSLLVEAMATLMILTVGILGVLSAIRTNFLATQDVRSNDQAHFAFESAITKLRETTFDSLYSTYTGKSISVDWYTPTSGGTATVQVAFNVDETALPWQYGPIADLDGDGVLNTKNVSAGYDLLPTRLTLTYPTTYGTETKSLYLVLGQF
jgi:Tfp pilus assembly protein PilW